MKQVIQGDIVPEMTPMPKIQGKPMTMDFGDAMKEVLKGNKVARVEWGNTDYGYLKDEWLGIFTKDRFFQHWNVSQGDLEGNDWIVVKEVS